MPDKADLRQKQSLPLSAKILMSQHRIREWYEHWDGNVYVSFSGGKDSTVLAYIVHDLYPNVPLVFCNTGLEYPEIQAFAKRMGAEFIRPKMSFSEVISTYGYPLIGKEVAQTIAAARVIRKDGDHVKFTNQKRQELQGLRDKGSLPGFSLFNKQKWIQLCNETQFNISDRCCYALKKSPFKIYEHKNNVYSIVGTLTEESRMREQLWMRHGCNSYDGKRKTSQPLSFWLEQDILKYIHDNRIEIASVYGDIVSVDKDGYEYDPLPGMDCTYKCTGCQRSGCIFCAFGEHLERTETKFQKLAKTHPRQYEYCMNGGQWVDNPNYDPTAPEYDGRWKNWNPKKIWTPSKKGLGMKKVFDDCNEIYGKDFIRYE